jgi:hypothetical protein
MSRISPDLLNQTAGIADPAALTVGAVTFTQLAPPAGGTGADVGAHDSEANRNLNIADLQAAKVDFDVLAAKYEVLRVEIALLVTAVTKMNLAAEECGLFDNA